MEKTSKNGLLAFLKKIGRGCVALWDGFLGGMTFLMTPPKGKPTKFQKFYRSPFVYFILLGLVFVFLQMLSTQGLIKISLMRGIGGLMISTIVALGFYILLGYAGLASLGTAGFVGLGTYMTGYLLNQTDIPTLAVFVIVILASIVLGLAVGVISLRIEGMYLAIITLCLSEILVQLFTNLDTITNGVNGLGLSPTPYLFDFAPWGIALVKMTRENVLYVIAAVFVILLILSHNITKSPSGRAMLAMKNSESAAQSMGISILKYRLFAFVIASVFAMIGGFLYELYWTRTYPTTWNIGYSLNILAAVVIGGTKSIWGLIIGCFLMFGLSDIVLKYIPFFVENSGLVVMLNGALMILVVMFYPGGISQVFLEIKYRLLARKIKKGAQHHV